VDLSEIPQLNLPVPADVKIRRDASGQLRIYDVLRSKWVALTPEEWVRQSFVFMLISRRGYLKGRLANEITVNLNGTVRRCDTVVFDRYARPYMIVEYKSPLVDISQRTFDQIARYNMTLNARYLAVSNGIVHYCCEMDYDCGSYRFLQEIPCYGE